MAAKPAKASIYALCHPETMELRYIGKANNPEARLKGHRRDSRIRNTPVCAWVRKLWKEGLSPEMIVLAEDCQDWAAKERELIARARFHGHRMLNLADGGNQPHCDIETRRKNGVNSAKSRNKYVWNLLREMGRTAREYEKLGKRPDIVAKARMAIAYVRSIPRDEHEAFETRHSASMAESRQRRREAREQNANTAQSP